MDAVIDTGWGYVISSEGLSLGESKNFEIMIKDPSNINTGSMSIVDYQ